MSAALVAAFVVPSCTSVAYSGKVDNLSLATLPSEIAGLIFVAQDTQIFPKYGLNVQIKPYDTGVAVTNAVINGEARIGLSAEYPFLGAVLAGEKVTAIAVVDKTDYFSLFGRRDAGIGSIASLKGKKIGSSRGTITDFYLGRFLALNGSSLRDVVLVNTAPDQIESFISDGTVDAVVAWSSFADRVRGFLGNNGIEWKVQAGQAAFAMLVVQDDWLAANREAVVRFLRSLNEAARLAEREPARAKVIVEQRMQYDEATVQAAWKFHRYSLSLDQSLILAMEDEARWMIANDLTAAKQVPNFLDYVSADSLKAVNPGAVQIVGK